MKFKPNTQQDEIVHILTESYPKFVEAHGIRHMTYIVDVPKVVSLLREKDIDIIAEITRLHKNKFGRSVRITSYKLTKDGYENAQEWIKKNIEEQKEAKESRLKNSRASLSGLKTIYDPTPLKTAKRS